MFAAAFALAFVLTPLADLGVNQHAARSIAADPESYQSRAGRFVGLKIALAGVYLAALAALGKILGYEGLHFKLLMLSGLACLANSLLLFVRSLFQAFQRFAADGVVSVADKSLLMLALLVPLMAGTLTILEFAYWTATTAVVTVGAAAALAVRFFGAPSVSFRLEGMKAVVRQSYPFALMFVLFSANEHLNKVLLELLAGEKTTGLYAAAFRWFAAFSMYLWTILPVFFAKFAAQQNESIETRQALFNQAKTLVAFPIIIVCGFVWFYGDKLFFLFGNSAPDEIETMSFNLKILAAALLVNGVFNVYSTMLTATGSEQIVARLLLVAVLASNGLNLWLIPVWGAAAVSFTLALSFAFLSAGYLFYFKKAAGLRVPVQLNARLALLGAGYAGALAGLQYTGVDWRAAFGGAAALACAAAWPLLKPYLKSA